MSRDSKVYLQDILTLINRIELSLTGITFEQLSTNPDKIDALLYNLLIIGEAVKHLPETTLAQYPQVPWRRIAGLRNILAHEYFRVNLDIVWSIVQDNLPAFKTQITQILEEDRS